MIQQMEIVEISKIELINANIDRICSKYPKKYKRIKKDGKKTCSMCKQLKSLDMFNNRKAALDGKTSWCKECIDISYAKRTGRTVEQVKTDRINKDNERKIIDGEKKCFACKEWRLISYFSKDKNSKDGLHSRCKECDQAYTYKETRRIKLICMMGYGGVCRCCGENRIELLSIEHIRNKGYNHIRGTTNTMMKKLIELEFTEGHEVLCISCNLSSKHMPCIHSNEYEEYYNRIIKPFKYTKQEELDKLEHEWVVMNGKPLTIRKKI